jgi:hypothetical protein
MYCLALLWASVQSAVLRLPSYWSRNSTAAIPRTVVETHWDTCDETVKTIVGNYVCDLPLHEMEAIWLQTEQCSDWKYENPETRDAYPVVDDDIIEYITNEQIYAEARSWSNARIRSYIEQSTMEDW